MQHTNINFKKRGGGSCRSLYSTIAGWSCVILTIFGLISYLTFVPEQAFAEYDWETRTLSDITTMQEMNTKICENSTENESKALKDDRDGKVYWVAKLADGTCWMTQNLAYNGGGISRGTSCAGWQNDAALAQYCSPGHTDSTHNSRGNYYSWVAAMNGNASATDGAQGVCPSGWRLPTAGDTIESGSFSRLAKAYGVENNDNGSTIMRDEPLYFQYSGQASSNGMSDVGSSGLYWSATPYGSSSAYHLHLYARGASPSGTSSRDRGFSVRCVNSLNTIPDPVLADSQSSVSIQVSPIINLDVAKSADDMVVDFNSIDTSTIDINVSSNQKYQVTLTTDQPNLIPNKSDNSEYSIKMVGTSGGIVEKGKNGWGIKKKLSATNDNNLGSLVNEPTYSPIGINNDQITFYRSAGPEALTNQTDPANPLQLEVGVSVDQSLPSDTYSTMVTVTAMAY